MSYTHNMSQTHNMSSMYIMLKFVNMYHMSSAKYNHDNRLRVLQLNLCYPCMRNHSFRRRLPPLRGLRPTRGYREPHRVCAADSDTADHIRLADAAGACVADMEDVTKAEEGDVRDVWEAR